MVEVVVIVRQGEVCEISSLGESTMQFVQEGKPKGGQGCPPKRGIKDSSWRQFQEK